MHIGVLNTPYKVHAKSIAQSTKSESREKGVERGLRGRRARGASMNHCTESMNLSRTDFMMESGANVTEV